MKILDRLISFCSFKKNIKNKKYEAPLKKTKRKKLGLISLIVFSSVLSSTAYSATLTVVTKYGDSGGNAGDLNEVGDKVNGNDICPAINDYSNAVPGCDMSADVGYNDNGTPLNAADDYTEGDLIVRTNDLFNMQVAYGWLGNAGGAEEQVTLTGTLPTGKGFIWEGIPGSCKAGSSLSEDKKTITCVRKDFDTNDTGSFAEDMAFPVRVEGDAVNGSIPGDIVFTVTDPTNSASATDGVEDGNANQLLKVTASPRWNIDKHNGPGYYTTSYGVEDDQGNPGWYLWYQFSIEVDEVDGTADDAPGRLGNEALQGGTDATITFVDDISQISPNAKLVTWSANSKFDPPTNPCTMDYYTNGDEPYASYNAIYPDRSIKVPENTMTVTCTPDGNGKINVTVDHIDGTLTGAPTKTIYGGLLPVNRAIAAIGLMRIFVPVSDVELGEDGIANTADDGSLTTTNCVSDFNPVGISGGSNFGNLSESEVDNCRNIALYSTAGSWDKNFRKGWSDQGVEIAKWGGGGWSLPPTDASIVEGGDGTVTPGGVFGTYTVYYNTGGTAIDDPVLCDVIDVETYDMTVIDPNADNAGTFLDDTKHAVDLNYSSTESVPGLTIQYAVGYVGAWPPNPNEAPSTGTDEVVNECSDPAITWYPDYVTAAANGPVSKVRISAPTLPAGKLMAMRIKHTARSTYLSTKNGHTAGEQIPNDDILVNHATYKSALTGNNYRAGDYYPKDASQNPGNGSGGGDRLIMVRAKARIKKAMEPAAVSPGSEVTVTLESSFTTDGPMSETENVTITDLLPKGLTYTNGSTTGTYGNANTNFGEPTIISPVTDADCTAHAQDLMDNGQACGSFGGDDNNTNGGQSLLIWDLGNQVTGTVFEDLVFHAIVDVDAPTGTLKNYALIDSPADSSAPSKRISNANTNDTVPSSLLIVKSVQTPLREVNSDSLLNWMKFRVGLRNGSSNQLTNLDVIDVIPFNGDGAAGSFKFTPQVGTTVDRTRVPATNYHGSFVFDDVSLDDNGAQCTGTPTYWFTDTADSIDVSAVHPSNDVSAGSANWCGDADTVDGAIANCNFPNGKADVRAVRVRGVNMEPSGTCFVNLKFATKENLDTDIYSNTAGAQALGVSSAVLSNTVSARVFASSIGDKVWFDVNADGVQNAGENGIPGVVVKLLDSSGNPVKDPANPANDYEVTTDAFGNYKFESLQSDDYQVKFELESSVITSKGSGGDTTLDSDADPATGIATVTLAENEDKMDIDVGIKQLSSIGDKVWNDLNRDGIQDVGELGVDGITVTLLDGSGNPILDDSGNLITITTTNDGEYKFDDLLPGTYSVGFSGLPADYVFSAKDQGGDDTKDSDANVVTGKTGSVTVAPGQDIITLDAGINKIEQPPVAVDDSKSGLIPGTEGSINVVSNDTDPENNLDPSTVAITGSPVDGAVISNNGKTITIPSEGVWNVAPDGTVTFTPDASFTGDPTPIKYKVSDTEGKVSNEATITLDYDPLRKISGNVGIDIDDNDTADKSPLSPVTITLYEVDGTTVVATTTTDSFGNYSFDVPGGNYVVKETDPTGVTSVSDIDGANDNTIAVDATTSDVPGNDFVDEPVLGNVKGIIFIDDNSDGIFNNAEAQTISDIDIVVTDAYGVEHNISTSAVLNGNGEYEYDLTGLPVGSATVSVNTGDPDLPEGATPTTPIVATVAIPANAYAEQDFGFNVPSVVDSDPKTLASCANPSSITWEGSTVGSQSIWHDITASTNLATAKEFTTVGDSSISVKMFVIDTDGQFNYADAGTDDTTAGSPNGVFGQPYLTLYLGDQNNNTVAEPGGLLASGEEATLHVEFDQSVILDNWRIRDLDSGDIRSGVANWDWQDAVRMKAYDANGDEVALTVSIGSGTNLKITNGFYHTDKDITGNPDDVLKGPGTGANSATGHIVYSSANLPIKRLEITHQAGPDIAAQTRSALALSGFAVCTVLEISGKVTNDANGNTDGVTGPEIETAGGDPLYAHLVDTAGNVIDVVTIAADGTYLFDKLIEKDTDYTVVLSSVKTDAGTVMATPVLPAGWQNSSEDTGSDANIDGILPVSVASSVITGIDFGLNEIPVANDVAGPSQLNPSNAQTVQVVGLEVTDPEDGMPTIIIIETLPTEGTLTYNGAPVTVGQEIPNFDPTKLLVDPNPGNVTVTFDYHTKDAAGAVSNTATATMPFTYEPPVAVDNAKSNPLSGSDTVVDVLTNDTKGSYDFDPTTVKIALPNGDRVTSLVVPDQGLWTVDAVTGAITFNPAPGFTGDPTPIQYIVSDISSVESNIANVTIDYPQTVPVANNDTKSGITNNPVVVDVAGNDTDPENDLDPTTVKLIDPTGNPVTGLIVSGEGTWTVDTLTGEITFTPEDGFTADPTPVNYTVRDKTGLLSNQATVTIDYEIQPPVADNENSIGNTPNTSVSIDPLDGDSDPDGSLDPSSVKLTGAGVSADGKTLTVQGEGVWHVDATTGEITFTPESSFTGNPTPVTYTVADNDGNPSNEATVTIEYRDLSTINLLKQVYSSDDKTLGHNAGEGCDTASSQTVIADADKDHKVYTTYCFTVTNTSAGYLSSVEVTDNTLGLTQNDLTPVGATPASLAPGESVTYYVERDSSESIENTATVSAIPSDSDGTATGENPVSSTSVANLTYYMPTSIGDTIWEDKNNDGVMDEGEALQGVEVTLTLPNGSTQTAVTDENGHYLFDDLRAGDYVVAVNEDSLPQSLRGRNTQDPDGGNDSTSAVTLDGENSNLDQDFAYHTPTGAVAGTVYEDTNGNGKQDPSEPGIANVKVLVTDIDGELYELTTDENGNYAQQVPIGDAVIDIDESTLPPSFTQTEGTDITTVTVPEDGIGSDVDGYKPPENAGTVEGVVYEDTNGNGKQDEGEPGIPGVKVVITDSTGGTHTVITDETGAYKETVPAGETIIAIDETTLPGGSIQTGGSNTTTVNVPEGGTATDEDWYQPLANAAKVKGIIFEDLNGNGIQDEGESGIPGVQVEVTDSMGNTQTVTTDANGSYIATVPAGETTLDVDETTLPGGSTQTAGTDVTTVTVPEGGIAEDLDGYQPTENSAQLTGVVYEDTNGNGIQDEDESGIPGVDVTVTDSKGNIQTLVTNAEGKYRATVPAGSTLVDIDQSDIDYGYKQTEGSDPTIVIVPAGGIGTDVDGFKPPASIGDTIWNDKNNDGVVDEGEALQGVDVTLMLPDGSTQTTTTDENGKYLFDYLPEGEFTVMVDESTLPEALRGNNSQDPDGGNDSTSTVVLDGTGNNHDQDFAYFVPGSIGDTIWHDKNNDGVVDEGEGLADITVKLTPPADIDLGNGLGVTITTTTGENGEYLFPNLPEGDYQVEVVEDSLPQALRGNNIVDPDGGNDSTSAVTLAAGDNNLDQDFAYYLSASIGDTIWEDKNNDGVMDEGEALQGVEVTLTLPNGSTQTAVTDENGHYLFEDLSAGEYVVTVNENSLPESLRGRNTQDPDGGNDSTSTVTLDGESSNLDQDFAYYTPRGVVAGTVYEDTNGNGKQDPSEPGIANIKVFVTDIDGKVYEVTTDNNGNYAQQVPIGDAVIDIDESTLPLSFMQTEGTDTTTVTVPEGGIASDVDGYKPPENAGAVEGVIYEDTNGNGVQDADELGIAGVSVIITDSTGGTQTLITDATGAYRATVPAGNTTIFIDESTLPGGSTQTQGSNSTTVVVPVNGIATDVDGYQPPDNAGKVTGVIFEDLNGDGIQNAGEVGIPGVQIKVTDSQGHVQILTTDQNGSYLATVPAGETELDIDESTLPGGSTQTVGTDVTTVIVPAGGIAVDIDGFKPADNSGLLTGVVYEDTNGNGVQDADEPGIAGVNVTVTDSEGNIQTLVTDAEGKYRATVPAGSTLVDIEQSDIAYGYVRTEGTDPTTVIVPAGGEGSDVDGFKPPLPGLVQIIKTAYGDDDVTIGHDEGAGCGTPRAQSQIILVDKDKSKDMPVTYCFEVTNTGESYLTDIQIMDETLGVSHDHLTLLNGPEPDALEPSASLLYYYEVTATESLNNVASVTASPSDESGKITAGKVTSEGNSTAKVALIIDPPSAMKTVTASGATGMEWQMVWINDSDVEAPGVTVFDEVPEGTHFEAMEAGEFVSASGVYCEARGSSSTDDSHDENCYYEGPSDDYPRGRIIWKGVVSSDPGKHTEDEADNEVVIRFTSVLDNPQAANQEIHNQGDSEWDYDNDGTPDSQVKTQAPTEDGGKTVFQPVNAIPTLSEWMLMLLALLLLVSGKRESMKLTGRKF